MKKFSLHVFVIFLMSVFLFTACKSKKALVQSQEVKIDRKLAELSSKVLKAEPVFNTANVSKMSAAIEIGGRRFNTQASCKIRTDSSIHVSIQPMLGIEMFKVEIDKDTFRVIDKFNKKVYSVNYEYFKKRFGIDVKFNDLQSIISNRFFTIGTSVPDLQYCKVSETQNNGSAIEFTKEAVFQKTILNLTDRISRVEIQSLNNNYTMAINYADFIQFDKLIFPQSISVNAKTAKRELILEFKVSKVVFDTNLNFTRFDTSKYSSGDINQLMTK